MVVVVDVVVIELVLTDFLKTQELLMIPDDVLMGWLTSSDLRPSLPPTENCIGFIVLSLAKITPILLVS